MSNFGTYLRGLWKQKPQAYGPFSYVQSSLFHNAESMGIDPKSIALAMPMWGPGDQIDYSKNRLIGTPVAGNTIQWRQEGIECNSSIGGRVEVLSFGDSPGSGDFTVIADVYHNSAGSYDTVMALGSWSPELYITGDDIAYYHTGGGSGYVSTGDAVPRGDAVIAWVRQNGSLTGYINGQAQTSLTYTTSISATKLNIGWSGSVSEEFEGIIKNLCYANSAFSASQIATLSDNPYQLWQPVPQRTYFMPTGDISFYPAWAMNCNNLLSGGLNV